MSTDPYSLWSNLHLNIPYICCFFCYATDANRNLAFSIKYNAWGQQRSSSGTVSTAFQYTDQRNDSFLNSTVGLYFYNAREYDPSLGRFIQADSVVQNPSNPQDWDRFAYVHNSPVNYNDPTGHAQCADWSHGCDEETNMTDAQLAALHARKGVETATADVIAATTMSPTATPTSTTSRPSKTPTTGTTTTQSWYPEPAACPECVLEGAAIFLTTTILEIPVTAAAIASWPAFPAEAVLIPTDIALVNFQLVGIELMAKGQTTQREDIKIDLFPLLHLFDPNTWK